MEVIMQFYLFLVSVVFISLSGVLLPGPLFAVTLDKGAKSRTAGLFIAFGHGVVEFPLMIGIYYGLTSYLMPETVQVIVGFVGGLLMIYMGFQSFMNRKKTAVVPEQAKGGAFVAGIWTTGANAGFILWWISIGTTLVLNARAFSEVAFAVFMVVHWLCDFAWYTLIGFLAYKSSIMWGERVQQGARAFCFLVLSIFGSWFLLSALTTGLSMIL